MAQHLGELAALADSQSSIPSTTLGGSEAQLQEIRYPCGTYTVVHIHINKISRGLETRLSG